MDWLRLLDTDKFLLFTLVLTRISGLTMTAPIYGTSEVPMRVRALLSFALALLITPTQWDVPFTPPGNTLSYLVLIGGELLIGVCLGYGIVILFSGVQLAGQMIGRISGLMLADVFDPNLDASVPTFARVLSMVTLAVFVCIGGHRMVMSAVLDTYATIPPGDCMPWQVAGVEAGQADELLTDSVPGALLTLLRMSFELGVRASVPVVTALLLSTLVMGLISRTLPQLNILMVGFGMNSMLTFAVFSLTLGSAAWLFQGHVETALNEVLRAIHLHGGTAWSS